MQNGAKKYFKEKSMRASLSPLFASAHTAGSNQQNKAACWSSFFIVTLYTETDAR